MPLENKPTLESDLSAATGGKIKGTWNGGREAEVWQQTHAPVLILDDPDKSTTEWSIGYLYDLLDQRMALTGGRPAPVLLVLNQLPKEFGEQLARHGHLGVATAQRGLQRGRPVLVDFSALPVWEEPLSANIKGFPVSSTQP